MVTERGRPVDLAALARSSRVELTDRILPYWLAKQDLERGGYLLADDAAWRHQLRHRVFRPRAKVKHIVSQARIVWTFSHVHRLGMSGGGRDYLSAATHGYRFIVDHFEDPICGGFVLSTERNGAPIETRKFVYAQAFVIYGFVEYARATGNKEPLDRALALHRLVDERVHDDVNGGWIEATGRAWQLLADVDERKSGDANLHWMEALTELATATNDAAVTRSLQEVVDINQTRFFPEDPREACLEVMPDWSPAPEPESTHLSYGHNAEFAWLMLRAEQVLGRTPSWERFYALIDHVLEYGVDREYGGVFTYGKGDGPPTDRRKLWWSQAEMIASLTDALVHEPNERYERALADLLEYVRTYQTDPIDGIWFQAIGEHGKAVGTLKAGSWKESYHEVRALVKLTQAFAPP